MDNFVLAGLIALPFGISIAALNAAKADTVMGFFGLFVGGALPFFIIVWLLLQFVFNRPKKN